MSAIAGLGSSLIQADFYAGLSSAERTTLDSINASTSQSTDSQSTDTVSLSDEALAALEARDAVSMTDIAQDMSAAEQATVLAADSAGDLLSAMFGEVSLFDGLVEETGGADDELEALVAML